MKVLLIHLEKDRETIARLILSLEKMNILFEILSFGANDECDIQQFTQFFGSSGLEKKDDTPTHVIILSSLSERYFDFLAGFACGSRFPFMIYGQDAIPGIAKEFAGFFSFLNNEDSLEQFLEAENVAFKIQESARKTIEAQETLLRMGIPVTVESLAQCIIEGRVQEVSLFLTAGFSPNSRNKAGVPLLSIAARNGNQEVLQFLLTAEADPDQKSDDRGTSALIDSAMAKKLNVMMDLIATGADLNIKSKDGQTALVVAVGAGEEKMVEALLKAGADPDITDSLGTSARRYAFLFKKEAITKLFDALVPAKAV